MSAPFLFPLFLDRPLSRPSFGDGASEREEPVTTDAEKEERDGEKPIVFNETFLVCLDRVPDSEQVCICSEDRTGAAGDIGALANNNYFRKYAHLKAEEESRGVSSSVTKGHIL